MGLGKRVAVMTDFPFLFFLVERVGGRVEAEKARCGYDRFSVPFPVTAVI